MVVVDEFVFVCDSSNLSGSLVQSHSHQITLNTNSLTSSDEANLPCPLSYSAIIQVVRYLWFQLQEDM